MGMPHLLLLVLLSTVVALCVLSACSLLLSTHGCVNARGGENKHKLMIGNIVQKNNNVIRTIDATVLNSHGPSVFVPNSDGAHNSSKRQVID